MQAQQQEEGGDYPNSVPAGIRCVSKFHCGYPTAHTYWDKGSVLHRWSATAHYKPSWGPQVVITLTIPSLSSRSGNISQVGPEFANDFPGKIFTVNCNVVAVHRA